MSTQLTAELSHACIRLFSRAPRDVQEHVVSIALETAAAFFHDEYCNNDPNLGEPLNCWECHIRRLEVCLRYFYWSIQALEDDSNVVMANSESSLFEYEQAKAACQPPFLKMMARVLAQRQFDARLDSLHYLSAIEGFYSQLTDAMLESILSKLLDCLRDMCVYCLSGVRLETPQFAYLDELVQFGKQIRKLKGQE